MPKKIGRRVIFSDKEREELRKVAEQALRGGGEDLEKTGEKLHETDPSTELTRLKKEELERGIAEAGGPINEEKGF